MYVYWYVSKFCLPQLTFPQTNAILVQGSNVQAEKCLIIIKLYREGKVK